MKTPWVDRLLMQRAPVLFTREQFIAEYFPRYVGDYRPPSGIKMIHGANGALHCQMSTPGSIKSQVTKRNNRIDAAFANYLSTFTEVEKLNHK